MDGCLLVVFPSPWAAWAMRVQRALEWKGPSVLALTTGKGSTSPCDNDSWCAHVWVVNVVHAWFCMLWSREVHVLKHLFTFKSRAIQVAS